MSSGGARARSGPPPDPNALRRDRPSDRAGWTLLPASGREGEPPAWPLARPKKRELALWASEWTRPQAFMWEARGQALEVALYVRAVVVAEGSKAQSSDRGLVLRLMDDLGISAGGLAKNRWVITDDARRAEPAQDAPRPARDRSALLELVVDNGPA